MYLKTVFIRFYKSFNDDFLRKNHKSAKPKSWEMPCNPFYPYIEVPIDPKITTIVGANESGKSHLLSAIEKAIFGENIKRSDVCRHSPFFTVKQEELKYPDFGSEWAGLSRDEDAKLREIIQFPDNTIPDRFWLFRNNIRNLTIYLPEKGEERAYNINEEQAIKLQRLLPKVIKIESSVALPSSVPIKKIIELGKKDDVNSKKFELLDREQRNRIVNELDAFSGNPEFITKVPLANVKKEEINNSLALEAIKSIISTFGETTSSEKKERREKEFDLAYKLICKIAQVDPDALDDLANAVEKGMQGYANGIIEKINRQLAINLNFPNYWVQDRNFCLKVMARDYDLVFTITDRTGTEYSFDERSQGLKFFLSYYIQYRSHEPDPNKNEILLMDEPDAYLSSQAQQDLLKLFDLFANPQAGSHLLHPIQVVYVTHSPFLIDKNHAERIRVLQKGNEDEGTRVVKDVSKNHYEPLRSSIGAYVGETVFIGNCNLMVEGISDQILIAGATRYLRAKGVPNLETLDLNQITIVPCGGASQIPYLVYLARGRDSEKPAVIVLLDGDNSGKDAKKELLGKCGQHRRPVIQEQFILQLADLNEEFSFAAENMTKKIAIEDIIPLPICIQATKLYLQEFLNIDETELAFLTEKLVISNINDRSILDAIQKSLLEVPEKDLKINKLGFSRNVIRVVNEWEWLQKASRLEQNKSDALQLFDKNFRVLFKKLNFMQRTAQQNLTDERLSKKIDRFKKDFIANNPGVPKREKGVILLDQIEATLKSNIENESEKEIEAIQQEIQNLRRKYKLDIDMNKDIDDYGGFKQGLERIKYAGLLASQEKTIEENQIGQQIISEEVEVDQINKSGVDNQTQAVNQKLTTNSESETAEVTDNPTSSKYKKK